MDLKYDENNTEHTDAQSSTCKSTLGGHAALC